MQAVTNIIDTSNTSLGIAAVVFILTVVLVNTYLIRTTVINPNMKKENLI